MEEMHMRSYAMPVILSLCFCNLVFGNSWVARYSGGGQDEAQALTIDGSGNTFVTGISNDNYVTVKYDPNGNEVWESHYNGPSNGYDIARDIALDGSGNIYVTGSSYDANNWDDYLTIKYNSDGNELWTARYNGPANQGDYACAIAVSSAGYVYVTGYSTGSSTGLDYATIKYNSSGAEQWSKRYTNSSSTYDDMAYAIAVDGSGNAYVTGGSTGSTTDFDYATIKYSNTYGNQLWERRYASSGSVYDCARAITIDSSDNVYVTGQGDFNYVTIKYNSGGSPQWTKIGGTPVGFDAANAIAVDSSGNVYVTGQSESSPYNYDYETVKYSSDGNQLWVMGYNGPADGFEAANAIAVDSSGNVYVTGQSEGGSVIGNDYATVKYDSAGNELWAARYNGSGHSYDYAVDMAVDGSGNVYVTGTSYGYETNSDYATIKNPNEVGYCTGPLVGDLNHDCVVNLDDFGEFASHWLQTNIQ
jgi:uncharacterized delta-60 repeat protein